MSIDPTIPVLYAQTGYTARVVHEAATAPQTAVTMARVMAEEMLRHQQQQVQSLEKGDEARVTDDAGQQKQPPFGSRRRKRQRPQEETEAAPSLMDTPLVGNLLNVKV